MSETTTALLAGGYTIDPTHSCIGFVVRSDVLRRRLRNGLRGV